MMDDIKKNELNEQEMENVTGGALDALKTSRCSVCGNLTPNYDLVDHYRKKVCKSCMEKINDK